MRAMLLIISPSSARSLGGLLKSEFPYNVSLCLALDRRKLNHVTGPRQRSPYHETRFDSFTNKIQRKIIETSIWQCFATY